MQPALIDLVILCPCLVARIKCKGITCIVCIILYHFAAINVKPAGYVYSGAILPVWTVKGNLMSSIMRMMHYSVGDTGML